MVIRMMIPGGLVGPSKGPSRMIMVGPFSVHWRFHSCLEQDGLSKESYSIIKMMPSTPSKS